MSPPASPHRCSATRSCSVWQKRLPFLDQVMIDGRVGHRRDDAVLRSGGCPCPCLIAVTEPLTFARLRGVRVTARPTAIDSVSVAIGGASSSASRPTMPSSSTPPSTMRPMSLATIRTRSSRTKACSAAHGSMLANSHRLAERLEWPLPMATTRARSGHGGRPVDQVVARGRSNAAGRVGVGAPRGARTFGSRLERRRVAMNEFVETLLELTWHEPKSTYDVVIVGGGGHGLSIAYHLAERHGITNVAVIEGNYIGSGNSGRNTTIIRSNYGIPESIRFYQHSLELYERLEAETGCWVMHDAPRPHLAGAHRGSNARPASPSTAEPGVRCRDGRDRPGRGQATVPADRSDRRRPLPGAGCVAPPAGRIGAPRSSGVGVRPGRDATRRARGAEHAGHRAAARRRSGDGRAHRDRRHPRRGRASARSAATCRSWPRTPACACRFARIRCKRS